MGEFTRMKADGNSQGRKGHKVLRERSLRHSRRASLVMAVWTLSIAGTAMGQLPPGGSVTQIEQPGLQNHARISDDRRVVLTVPDENGTDVYVWIEGDFIRLTDDGQVHGAPTLNNIAGTYAFWRSPNPPENTEIALLVDEGIENLTDTPEQEVSPDMNEGGQMVWEQWSLGFNTKEIFFFDPEAGDPVMITDGDPLLFNLSPRISDIGTAVWVQFEDQFGILNGPARIMHSSQGQTQVISTGLGRSERFVTAPAISSNGDVYWADNLGDPRGPVFRWRDGETTEVLPYGSPAAANDRGDVLFRQGANTGMTWLYRNGLFYQAFGGMTAIGGQDMNANGDAVGHGFGEAPRDIFLLTIDPISGDHDEDGDLDIDDLVGLSDCLAGPGEGLRNETCSRVDFNGDGHVDLRDAAAFGTDFTGDCALGITTPPGGQDVCVGDEVRMDVDVRGRVASYQWTYEREPIAGATDREYVIDRAELSDWGEYGVIVTSECGWESRSDKRHHLTVHRDPPTFSTQPDSQEACRGQDIQYRSLMGGNNEEPYGFVTFQWQKDGVDLAGENWFFLVVRDVDERDEGEYRCVATNACGVTISRTATLTLAPDDAPPRILIQPRDVQVDPGQPASFNVLAACADSFQWKKDGVDMPGETRSDLFIFPATCDDEGEYEVTAINEHGEVTSDPARLTVNNCP